MGLKFILFSYFGYCIYDSRVQSKKNKPQLEYLMRLMQMGACYMLATPIAVFLSYMFEPYERQYVYTLTSETIMFMANVTMLVQLTSRKSTYRKASLDDIGLPHNL